MLKLERKIFRASDIRGIYPNEINGEIVFTVAQGLSRFYRRSVVIGYDARLSSPALYRALERGLHTNKKLRLIKAGLITTPTLYFLVNTLTLDGGIIITASHNPKDFNGMKIVGKRAQLLGGEYLYNLLQP